MSNPALRLRDLGFEIGVFPPGPGNRITDVAGVRVGHTDIAAGLMTGITAVIPYELTARKLYIGLYGLDGGDGMTGLGVTEDFGAISTPIMFAPQAAVGQVYDAVITRGLGLDAGLGEDAGWPPIVIGVDDSWINPPTTAHRTVNDGHADEALAAAGSDVVEGSYGIGRGLVAFGGRGGVGTASRRCDIDGATVTVGALVVVNGGEVDGLTVDGLPLPLNGRRPLGPQVPRTAAAVIITDAPLIPRQLGRLAGRAAFGLVRVGLFDGHTRDGLVVAVSTTGLVGRDVKPDGTASAAMVGESELSQPFTAAAECCEESVLNALLMSTPLPDRGLAGLAAGDWVDGLRGAQSRRRSKR